MQKFTDSWYSPSLNKEMPIVSYTILDLLYCWYQQLQQII
jgi:hypothetical protein